MYTVLTFFHTKKEKLYHRENTKKRPSLHFISFISKTRTLCLRTILHNQKTEVSWLRKLQFPNYPQAPNTNIPNFLLLPALATSTPPPITIFNITAFNASMQSEVDITGETDFWNSTFNLIRASILSRKIVIFRYNSWKFIIFTLLSFYFLWKWRVNINAHGPRERESSILFEE